MIGLRKTLLEVLNPVVQAKRFRGKINVQKPKAPHFERAKFLAISKPWFVSTKKNKASIDLCSKNATLKNDENFENPFQKILAKEALDLFQSSRLIGFYHANPIHSRDQFKAYAMFHKEGMLLKSFGRKTLEMAVKNTPYEVVLDIYISRNMIVFSPELKMKQLLKITKRIPQLVLMAGICEGKFLNLDDMVKYSTVPNLTAAQSMLVYNLNSAVNRLQMQLNSHQTKLLALLNDRKKQLEDINE